MDDESQQKKAGEARAASMTTKERKALATRAAHARWKKSPDGFPVATHEGEVKLGPVSLPCAVLADGRRIFSERGLSEAFTHVRSGSEFKKRAAQTEAERLPVFLNETIAAFMPTEARAALAAPIRYRRVDDFSIPAWGIDANLLPEICDAYLAARDAGALKDAVSLRKAAAAERLMRALAKVALAALIDEATGYQVERDRDELQKLLGTYIREEFRPWQSMFPTQFYVEMFRLRSITTDDVRKRPAYFGKLTNDIVYDRMLPGMRARLSEVNPVAENGRRSRKHHQHMTSNQGVQHMREHLAGVLFLMKSSTSWEDFVRRLDRAAPRQGDTLRLPNVDGET
jgi:hypothetical protein